MRRGCVSLGRIKCDACHHSIPNGDRYLIVEEPAGDNAKNKLMRYCTKCCEAKGLIGYRKEKDEKFLTFFPPDERTIETRTEEGNVETGKLELEDTWDNKHREVGGEEETEDGKDDDELASGEKESF